MGNQQQLCNDPRQQQRQIRQDHPQQLYHQQQQQQQSPPNQTHSDSISFSSKFTQNTNFPYFVEVQSEKPFLLKKPMAKQINEYLMTNFQFQAKIAHYFLIEKKGSEEFQEPTFFKNLLPTQKKTLSPPFVMVFETDYNKSFGILFLGETQKNLTKGHQLKNLFLIQIKEDNQLQFWPFDEAAMNHRKIEKDLSDLKDYSLLKYVVSINFEEMTQENKSPLIIFLKAIKKAKLQVADNDDDDQIQPEINFEQQQQQNYKQFQQQQDNDYNNNDGENYQQQQQNYQEENENQNSEEDIQKMKQQQLLQAQSKNKLQNVQEQKQQKQQEQEEVVEKESQYLVFAMSSKQGIIQNNITNYSEIFKYITSFELSKNSITGNQIARIKRMELYEMCL